MKSIANLSIGGNIEIQMLWLDGNADHLCFSTEEQPPNELTKREQQLPHSKPMSRGPESSIRTERAVKSIPEFHSHEWMMKWDQQVPHNKPAFEFSMRTPQAVPEFQGHEPMNKTEQKPRSTSEFHGFSSVDIIRFNYNSDGASFLCYSLSMFPCLKELRLINLNIQVIPDDVFALQLLEKLDWSGNDFETLPETMNQLPRLKYVSLCNCSKLKALPELVQLETIKLSGCINLQSLSPLSHAEQDLDRFQWLELWVGGSHDFETLPSSIGELSSLGTLCLNKCKKLKSVEGVPLSLKYLYAHGCESLETVSLPLNHSIKHLDLTHCFCLKQDEHLITQFLNDGKNQEESPRFACLPATEVPSYFGDPETGMYITVVLPPIWPFTKILGFDGCVMIACERPFHMQFSPFSYNWEVDRIFRLDLQPDFIHPKESSSYQLIIVLKKQRKLLNQITWLSSVRQKR